MWWYGRGNSGGSWLPEEEIVVAHGRLPSPARVADESGVLHIHCTPYTYSVRRCTLL